MALIGAGWDSDCTNGGGNLDASAPFACFAFTDYTHGQFVLQQYKNPGSTSNPSTEWWPGTSEFIVEVPRNSPGNADTDPFTASGYAYDWNGVQHPDPGYWSASDNFTYHFQLDSNNQQFNVATWDYGGAPDSPADPITFYFMNTGP
jgi:hypothetical protein